MLTKSDIRLECLKLAHAHGREAPQVIERAKAYEAYVTEDFKAAESKPEEPNGKKATIKANGKAGNLESLL